MRREILEMAIEELEDAETSLKQLKASSDYRAFKKHWKDCLRSWKGAWNKLDDAASGYAASTKWLQSKRQEKNNDPLTHYLYVARDAAEHGIKPSTEIEPGYTAYGVTGDGFSDAVFIEELSPQRTVFRSLDGKPVRVVTKAATAVLVQAVSKKATANPPTEHLGRPLTDRSPAGIAQLGIDYLRRAIAEAEAFAAPNRPED